MTRFLDASWRQAWVSWWRNVDGPALLAAFQKRTLNPEQTAKALSRIAELGVEKFATRQRAEAEVAVLGSPAFLLLRQACLGAPLHRRRERLGRQDSLTSKSNRAFQF